MMSFFYCGVDLKDFLFKGLNTASWRGLFGICVMITTLALGHEGLHLLKRYFLTRFLQIRKQLLSRTTSRSPDTSDDEAGALSQALSRRRRNRQEEGSGEPAPRSLLEESDHHEGDGDTEVITQRPGGSGLGGSHGGFLYLGVSSVLHSIYMFLGFTLMNAVMSFNAWILVAVGVGVAIGYFLFGNYRREDILIRPLSRETTSTNDNESGGCPSPPTNSNEENLRKCLNYGATTTTSPEEGGESSRLVVGAQVHFPRNILGSSTPT